MLRLALLYAYLVSFASVVTLLISLDDIVHSAYNLTNPLRASGASGEKSVRTLVEFKQWSRSYGADLLEGKSKEEVRQMFEEARRDAIEQVRFEARRSISVWGAIFLAAGALLVSHLVWAGKLRARDLAATGEMKGIG